MDPNTPPPEDHELPAMVQELLERSQAASLDDRRAAFEGLYELAYQIGPKIAHAIPVLIEGLATADPKVGESALWALHYCSPNSLEPLIECLAHPQAIVRERAAYSLGSTGDGARRAVPSLLGLLTDEEQAVRRRAAWAIGLMHDTAPDTIEALAQRVSQGTAEDIAASLHALGNIGQALEDRRALSTHQSSILACLDHENSDVRWSALFATKPLGLAPQFEVELLSPLLQREQSDRVVDAVLARLKELAPITDLFSLLPAIMARLAESRESVSKVCEVLSAMQPAPREAIDPLLQLLEADDLVLPAAKALWKIDNRSAPLLPAIARIFDDDPESACDLIYELGPAAAPLLPQLITALATEDWDLQWAAADALGAIASTEPRSLDALLDALWHPSPVVRSASARALAKVGSPVVPQLRCLLRDQADNPNAWAAYALGKIGPSAIEAIPELRASLRCVDPVISGSCAIAIAHISGDCEVIPYLITILESEDANAPRRDAARALSQLGPRARDAIDALSSLIHDEDYEVQEAAHEALKAIKASAH